MASTFVEGFAALREKVGEGTLKGSMEINQHYALEQHENLEYEHPRGGTAKYLSGPFMESYKRYMIWIAISVLKGELISAMAESMEDLSSQMDPRAPIDEDPNFIRLRRSGHPVVTDNGIVKYDRPPVDPREPMMAPDDEERALEAEINALPSF